MGQIMGKTNELDLENIPEGNGNFMHNTAIPDEILLLIFSHLPDATLVTVVPRVCKHWNKLSDDFELWALRLARNEIKMSKDRLSNLRKKWTEEAVQLTLKYLCVNAHRKGFNQNLIKNPYAAENCNNWEVVRRGNGITIESPPVGCEPIPTETKAQHCWVTSYDRSIRSQNVNLKDFGIYHFMLDILQPTLLASEWVCGRFDCSSESHLRIKFKGDSQVRQKVVTTVIEDDRTQWQKVDLKITSDELPAGLKTIIFQNSGGDRQFWWGYYGSKSTASTMILDIASDIN